MLNDCKLDFTWNKVFKKNGIPFSYFGLPKPVRQFSGPDWAEDNFCQSEWGDAIASGTGSVTAAISRSPTVASVTRDINVNLEMGVWA